MSLFEDDLGLTDAPDDPNAIPNATYDAFVKSVKVQKSGENSKKPGHPYLVFTYKIEGGDYNGTEVSEWKSAHKDDGQREKAFIKQRLLSLGVPADKLDTVSEDDLVGIRVKVTTRMKDGFINVNKVVLDDPDSVTSVGGLSSLM